MIAVVISMSPPINIIFTRCKFEFINQAHIFQFATLKGNLRVDYFTTMSVILMAGSFHEYAVSFHQAVQTRIIAHASFITDRLAAILLHRCMTWTTSYSSVIRESLGFKEKVPQL